MLIVAGSFAVEPEQRDAFLAGRLDAMRATRDEPGCLEYVMSADPIDPSRVVLFERWADQAAFDGHMVAVQLTWRLARLSSRPRSARRAPELRGGVLRSSAHARPPAGQSLRRLQNTAARIAEPWSAVDPQVLVGST